MSTSKRRRAARAWMGEERARSNTRADQAWREGAQQAKDDARRAMLRIIPADPNEDTFYPQGRLEQTHIRVYTPDPYSPPMRLDIDNPRDAMRLHNAELSMLVAKPQALILPNGHKVMWWSWELGR